MRMYMYTIRTLNINRISVDRVCVFCNSFSFIENKKDSVIQSISALVCSQQDDLRQHIQSWIQIHKSFQITLFIRTLAVIPVSDFFKFSPAFSIRT